MSRFSETERVAWGACRAGTAATLRAAARSGLAQRIISGWTISLGGLWRLAEEAKALVHDLITKHAIACDWRPGLIETTHKKRLVAGEIAYVERLKTRYNYAPVEWLDKTTLASAIGTDAYFGVRRRAGDLRSGWKFRAG